MKPIVALSLRQPWAALLVAGVKSIEVRKWKTLRQGTVLIHAAKLLDTRPQAWAHITTPELRSAAGLRGGIVGIGQLTECRIYHSATQFVADANQHLNAPEWFQPPQMFGFVFRDIQPMNFYPYTGQTFFFGVRGFSLSERENTPANTQREG